MRLRALIRGHKVHGVGYRNHLLLEADSMGMEGFSARNLRENGLQLVEVLFEGDETQVSSFMEFIRSSRPKAAEVSEISFEEYEGRVERLTRFAIRFQAIQLSKGVESILRIEAKQDQMLEKQDRMLEKQDAMLEKQDRMLEKQDAMLEKQDLMLERQDLMIEKQDETVEELRGVRSDLKDHMEKRFARIEEEIAEIKRAIRELGGSCA
ncbi:acylphosphatase [Methanothrix sp.]|uniref:acylphosphatase n=1 Tax=Methanothrix sp. TaxID=90426 RepID=UPI003C758B0F